MLILCFTYAKPVVTYLDVYKEQHTRMFDKKDFRSSYAVIINLSPGEYDLVINSPPQRYRRSSGRKKINSSKFTITVLRTKCFNK